MTDYLYFYSSDLNKSLFNSIVFNDTKCYKTKDRIKAFLKSVFNKNGIKYFKYLYENRNFIKKYIKSYIVTITNRS